VNAGGGILLAGTMLNLTNTIISASAGGDCLNLGGTLATNSHNLIQDGSCSPMLSGDPMLGPLQNNSGPTSTRALLAGSPAIDAGDDSVTGSPLSLATDQRGTGFLRLAAAHVDIGAFEVQQAGNNNSFDTCVKDTNSGNLFQFSSTTGAYSFTICGKPAVTGTGKVTVIGATTYLTDFSTPARKISAFFNHGQLTGRATVTLSVAPGVFQTTIVNQSLPNKGSCACQ
jgi:hypothetical protein